MVANPDDLEICKEITRKGGSNLSLISRGLNKPRRNLFAACYASMRLIDDLVDENFLALSPEDRVAQRAEYIKRVDDWHNVSVAALRGHYIEPKFAYKLSKEKVNAIFRALSATAGRSNIGPRPWIAMADAMRRDVREYPVDNWEDFSSYASGATVSPTAIYLYILSTDYYAASDRYTGRSGDILMDRAKYIGQFCYLVHIARDLVKDSTKNSQLLTIPRDLRSQISEPIKPEEIRNITVSILRQASIYDLMMRDDVLDIEAELSRTNKTIFRALLGHYSNMYHKMRDDPMIASHPDFEREVRESNEDFHNLAEDIEGTEDE